MSPRLAAATILGLSLASWAPAPTAGPPAMSAGTIYRVSWKEHGWTAAQTADFEARGPAEDEYDRHDLGAAVEWTELARLRPDDSLCTLDGGPIYRREVLYRYPRRLDDC